MSLSSPIYSNVLFLLGSCRHFGANWTNIDFFLCVLRSSCSSCRNIGTWNLHLKKRFEWGSADHGSLNFRFFSARFWLPQLYMRFMAFILYDDYFRLGTTIVMIQIKINKWMQWLLLWARRNEHCNVQCVPVTSTLDSYIETLRETETKTGTHNAHTLSERVRQTEKDRQIDTHRVTPRQQELGAEKKADTISSIIPWRWNWLFG